MKKIELEVVALSHSLAQTHSYAVVLGEINGTRKLPIVIGASEAQAIAVALENMHPGRPLTHDLMKSFMLAFNVDLHEIVINDLQEGIFYSKLVCSSEKETIEIDSRTSDAIALAVRFGSPIFTYESILNNAGLTMEADDKKLKTGFETKASEVKEENELSKMSLIELNNLLSEVLEREDYVRAIAIRDEIKSRKK